MPAAPPIHGVFRDDSRARAAYAEGAGIYRIIPSAVAVPADLEDLIRLVTWCVETSTPLVPRGAGSAVTGSSVGDGLVVDLSQLGPRRLEVNPGTRTAVTSAGVTLGALNAAAAEYGLRLPPDPSSARWATCGGAFATDAAGARSLRYGSMRRWVAGCAGITADGEPFRVSSGELLAPHPAAFRRFQQEAAPRIRAASVDFTRKLPATRKNTSGYAFAPWIRSGDIAQLLCGSEGTLALVTEITWRLDPLPAARRSLRVTLAALDTLGDAVAALLPLEPSACELLDRTFLDVARRDPAQPVPEAEAVLLVEFEGEDAAAVADGAARAAAALAPFGARVELATSDEEAERLWALRHAASPILARMPETTRSLQVVEDGCVPIARLAEYVRLLRDAAARREIPIVLFGHAGDGHVHANLLPDVTRPGWEGAVLSLFEEVTGGLLALGGTPAGEHGDGRLRAPLLERVHGAALTALYRRTKAAFDPHGILNPGVILPAGPAAPLARLKVGTAAASLPTDIAAGLRAIEREGGYATPRLTLADRTPATAGAV